METILITLPTIEQVTFDIIVHDETAPIRGNCIDSGDAKYDEKIARRIERQLDNGNVFAWCTIEVRANYKGLQASDYLGCCSYKSERDFKIGGYYDDMTSETYGQIIEQLKALRTQTISK